MKTTIQSTAKPKILRIDELEAETLYNYELNGDSGVVLAAYGADDGKIYIVELSGTDDGLLWTSDTIAVKNAKFTHFVGKLVLEND